MFIAALFTIAKTGKQLKCPSTEEWIKMLYIYTMEYYSSKKTKKKKKKKKKKNEWNNTICSNIDRPRDYHTSEVSQRKISIIWHQFYEES